MSVPSRNAVHDEVYPWMRQYVLAGVLIGGILATLMGGGSDHVLRGAILRGSLGAVAGGLFGALMSMLWAVKAPGRAVPTPEAARTADLWDPWLDDEDPGEGAPGVPWIVARSEVVPELAIVRPRVLSVESGEAMSLEDEVLPLARAGECGAIRISGPLGSGKTTALRHLAAVLPERRGVGVLDDPDMKLLAVRSACGLVIYASDDSSHPKHIATYHLAPWGDDDLIEYLLGSARERCGSVMTRLKEMTDRDFIEGNPELWRIVLDRMAADATVSGVRHALRREMGPRLVDPELRSQIRALCLAILATPQAVPSETREMITRCCRDQRLHRLVRHRPIQILLAAGRIADDLERGVPCDYLTGQLPRDLILETASLVRQRSPAIARLGCLLDGGDRGKHPMAASLLHATRTGWRPPIERVPPRLSRAYLDRVEWSGVDLYAAEIEGTDLSEADLTSARLDGARASDALLRRAKLSGASFIAVRADGANLRFADLSSIRAERVQLESADMEEANLEGAWLRFARLDGANLAKAILTGAELTGAHLKGANIEGADFTGAILSSAILSGLTLHRAEFRRAVFSDADLGDCNLEGMELPQADFQGARLRGALLTGSNMAAADFRRACLQDAGLAEVEWEGARLVNADLRRASFHLGSSRSGLVQSPIACEGSRTGFYTDDFDEQDFKAPEEIRKANLRGADLRGALIDGVDFYLVDLRGAVFDPAQAEHFRRCGAILEDRC